MLAANRFNSLVAIRLPEDVDNFFGAVELLFYEYFLLGKVRNTLIINGANPCDLARRKRRLVWGPSVASAICW